MERVRLPLLTAAVVIVACLVPAITPADARRPVAPRLQQFSRDHWPGTFGGLWLRRSRSKGEHIAVAFTRGVAKRRETILRIYKRPGVYIKVVKVDLTEHDLARIQREVVKKVDRLPIRSWGVGQDIMNNRVSVTLPKPMPKFESHLRYLYGSGNVHFDYGVISPTTG